MALKTMKFDPMRYLRTDDELAFYLSEALATNDAAYIAHALGVVARAKGMTAVAKDARLSRENLYRSLSENGNPELDTVLRVTKAIGLKLTAAPAGETKTRRRSAKGKKAA